MKRLLPSVLLAVAFVATAAADPGVLTLGRKVSGTLTASGSDSWRVSLAAGRRAVVEVAQKEADVRLVLLDPAGTVVAAVDDIAPPDKEVLEWTTEAAGVWQIRLEPVDGGAGAYAITWTADAAATEHDRQAWQVVLLDQQIRQRLGDPGSKEEVPPLADRLFTLRGKVLAADPAALASADHDLGSQLSDAGFLDVAQPFLVRSVTQLEKLRTADQNLLAVASFHLAKLYALRNEAAPAEPLFRRALSLWKGLGKGREAAIALTELAKVARSKGEPGEAERLGREALDLVTHLPKPDPRGVASCHSDLGVLYLATARYADAERELREAIAVLEGAVGPESPELARDLNNLAELYRTQAKLEKAEGLYRRALSLARRGNQSTRAAQIAANLGLLLQDQEHYKEAEIQLRQALADLEAGRDVQQLTIAGARNNLGELLITLGRYGEAEPLIWSALEMRQAHSTEADGEVAASLDSLARLWKSEGRFNESEAASLQALSFREAALEPGHPDIAKSLTDLGELYLQWDRAHEAEGMFRHALAIYGTAFGEMHYGYLTALDNLGTALQLQGRAHEAEDVLSCVLALQQKAGSRGDGLASVLNNLAALYDSEGRLREALISYRQALQIITASRGVNHSTRASILQNLAALYESQNRPADAEPLYRQALTILEHLFPEGHPLIATVLVNLANVVDGEGRPDEAETLYRRALALRVAAFGEDSPEVAETLTNLAGVYFVRGKDVEVERLLRQGLAVSERVLSSDHPRLGKLLYNLAFFLHTQDRNAEADIFLARALSILEATPLFPGERIGALALRAKRQREQGNAVGARQDIDRAVELAGVIVPRVGGGEETKAAFLATYADLFHTSALWSLEDGQIAQAFALSERRRGRSLLDQLAAAGVDWRAGIAADLRQREEAARARLTEQQARLLNTTDRQVATQVAASLRQAEMEYREAYEEMKNESPLWQRLRGQDPIDLAAAQRDLVPAGGLLLVYEIGWEDGVVFVVPPVGEAPQALPLTVPEDAARALGVRSGPLGARALTRALAGEGPQDGAHLGILDALSRSTAFFPAATAPPAKLHALWQALVPAGLWPRLARATEVVVVPDGPLHRLPFDALVVRLGARGSGPVYWLDQGPLLRYAPSATVLSVLGRRPPAVPRNDGGPDILSLTDPIFDPAELARLSGNGFARSTDPGLGPLPGDGRSAAVLTTGPLPRLRGTALEGAEILSLFGKARVKVLTEAGATESAVRDALPGKRWVHLATHGLVEQRGTGLFASLVLTPPTTAGAPPEDDGFLQLHEIYDLDLSSCALAVLSACRTNAGSELEGEGVFALSRGMLVAGARRVVASQWPVNDASTAALMEAFYRALREASNPAEPDYARALRTAQIAVRRKTGPWAEPHYWAPFVLIGVD